MVISGLQATVNRRISVPARRERGRDTRSCQQHWVPDNIERWQPGKAGVVMWLCVWPSEFEGHLQILLSLW